MKSEPTEPTARPKDDHGGITVQTAQATGDSRGAFYSELAAEMHARRAEMVDWKAERRSERAESRRRAR